MHAKATASARPCSVGARTSRRRTGGWRPSAVLGLLAATILAGPRPTFPLASVSWASGSDTVRVVPARCTRCGLSVIHEADLARDDGYDVDLPSFSVATFARGGFATTGFGEPFVVNLFDRTGKLVGHVGRRGEGPGEFSSPKQAVIGPADSIWVLDRTLRRLQVFGSQSQYTRLMSVARVSALGFTVLGNGTAVVAGHSSTAAAAGFPLHSIRGGEPDSHPFGEPEPAMTPDRLAWLRRSIGPTADGNGLWSARVNKYEVSLLDSAGRTTRVFDVAPNWFAPWETNQLPVYEATRPTIIGVQSAPDGRVLVYIATTARGFRPAQRKSAAGGETVLPPLGDILKNFDTVVEVLDPSPGRIVAREVFTGYMVPAGRFPFAARVRDRPDGGRFLEIVRLAIR